ncbi:C2 domain-containing protein 3 isoform C [Alligator mississippiensis]|uniref:C2 domain-containing protein 3 isoform C n=1 Tax=Alligator mississippiensis TaxID=8496 RepID=A0A151PIZ0_ALLMI|nr:C2 domain-containing protein 3 isoform C [Alligator mississippiensis]
MESAPPPSPEVPVSFPLHSKPEVTLRKSFLKGELGRVVWAGPAPPAIAAALCLRWWGDASAGTFFRAGPGRSQARFPVRCGPAQLAAYLADMGALVLEVITKPDHLPIGKVQINGLSQLSPSNPISGFFTIVSPTSEKLGEVQISLVLEPFPETYDKSSSLPTTDASKDIISCAKGTRGMSETSKPQFLAPPQTYRPPGMCVTGRESADSSRAATPRGKDHLFFQENSENIMDSFFGSQILPDETLKPNPSEQQTAFPNGSDFETQARTTIGSHGKAWVLPLHSPVTKDLLSALLDQGNKLCNAMAVSAMKSSPDTNVELSELHPPIKGDAFKATAKSLKTLNSAVVSAADDPLLLATEYRSQEFDPHAESRAIQLLLGSTDLSSVPFWDGTGSPPESLTAGSELYDSEPNDPPYDQSLLENLFYTAPKSDTSLSDFLSNDEDGISSEVIRTRNLVKNDHRKGSQKALDSGIWDQNERAAETKPSCSAKLQPGSEASIGHSKKAPAINLTVDKLALLGRIHLARVIIESLKIPPESSQATPGKKSSVRKPPRPALAKKCTFFVEYHFPVGISKNETGQVSIATEVIRIASSKVAGEVVKFQQRFVFPVRFGGMMIEHWWNSDLAFKIYMRKRTQKKPVLIGSAAIKLRTVLESELLTVSCELPVEEEGGQTPLGPLKVLLELAADNKDFASASARSPAFNFSQVMPFSLTPKHLERLKNNVMVIEAWNKMGNPGCDRLLGLVKLPLHQFYMSFKDPQISRLLLQAQYPVVAVDSYMPVMDVFAGRRNGSLRVILAMGSADQIVALQRLKSEDSMVAPVMQRPAHSLDPLPTNHSVQLEREREGLMEHIFEIHVEKVKGLTPLQSTVWGEADCYVQYHFPIQEPYSSVLQATELHENGIRLKPFRSATTLCIPDPVFNDEHRHSLLVPADVPVQRLLLSAFSTQGLTGGGGIHFEIWCRYYYPNVRDQMVARGTLPLSRLCAMVTMQHHEEIGVQTFNLPLVPRSGCSEEFQPRSSGLLDVSVRYRHSLKTAEGVIAAHAISISVQIHRAAGLQAAARAVAEKNPLVQYSAEVGVNAYVSMHLSFLPEGERRTTRTVAHTFCPEFEHHVELPCNLVIQRSSGEACSLGELLQSAEIIFSIYHQSTESATDVMKIQASRDYLLGIVRVPTKDLLVKRSGITGWCPVTLPEDLVPSQCTNFMQTIVGGLEVSVTFAHHDDRERVVEAAKLLAWNGEENHEDSLDDSDEWQLSKNPATVTVSTPRVWLPIHSMLLAGQTHINKSTYCYLREEKLEIQVWRAYGKEPGVERPLDTDRLIGSAYVDLTALSERTRRILTVSGVYPLFRRNASNLSGAAIRVHIVLASTPACVTPVSGLHCAEEGSQSEDEGTERVPDTDQPALGNHSRKLDFASSETPNGKPVEEIPTVHQENTFMVSVLVERAMHLSLKGSPITERGVTTPSSYVSFAVADADTPVMTTIIENTDSPVWDFQQQARLSKELLLDPQQTLVFKVWHKADVERVIGFASVDLSPLLSGFQLVCGWYNITDLSGQCRGQMKVAISPLESIIQLKEERQARIRTKASASAIPVHSPFSFQARALCTAFPSDVPRCSEPLLTTSSDGRDFTAQERCSPSGTWTPRHEEHMQNVRRFHESLQQAEGNAQRAGRFYSLSHSSRASLLTALRKNLSELDEIQRYFSKKLTRSFPDLGYGSTASRNQEWQDGDQQGSMTRMVDADGCQLLEKSSHLVSQVSTLINDLQTITKNAKESSNALQGHSRNSGAKYHHVIPDHKDEAVRTKMHQSQLQMEQSSGYDNATLHLLPSGRTEEEACVIESHSDEEYEEDVIEPRTLNEITTVTDKTSPWSSLASEVEQGPSEELVHVNNEGQHPVDNGSLQKRENRRSSSLSNSRDFAVAKPSGIEREEKISVDLDVGDQKTEAARDSGSCSDEILHEESEKPVKASVVLPDPVAIPNFFLPPQHLEVSMRMLNASSQPSAMAPDAGSGATAGGIPYRRQNRLRPKLTSADLPEQETRRIARIFSAQLSKKE